MKTTIFGIYFLFFSTSMGLRWLNLRRLKAHAHQVPPELQSCFPPERLRQAAAYTVETSRLAAAASILNNILLVWFFFGGLIAAYDGWIASLSGSFVGRGVLFVLGLFWAETLCAIPFSLYKNFRIESRHGFNTMSGPLWLGDLLKTTGFSSVLLALLAAAALFVVRVSPGWWWLWSWVLFLLFSIFFMYISPYVIEPLFFKFGPLPSGELVREIHALVEKAGLEVDGVLQMDASRRSRHSNAYFTGIGRVKRIVLFDTLLEEMGSPEVLAVLAHELGHWKKRHLVKRIALLAAAALATFFATYKLVGWQGLPELFGLEQASFYPRLSLLGFLGSLLLFPLTPLWNFLSRRQEWQADRVASQLTGRPLELAKALARLAGENLANIHPHPLYATFYYSHPPVVKRVRRLLQLAADPAPDVPASAGRRP